MREDKDILCILLLSTELAATTLGNFHRPIHLKKVIEILENNHQHGYECGCMGCYVERFRVAYYDVADKDSRDKIIKDFIHDPISNWLESNPDYIVDGFEEDHIMGITGTVNTLNKTIMCMSDTIH